MILWETGTVMSIIGQRGEVQELLVRTDDGNMAKAIHYLDVLRPVSPGDRVRLNATAVKLNLGSGGYHFVYALLEPEENDKAAGNGRGNRSEAQGKRHGGHLMKLRYTPAQRAVLSAEEPASPYHRLFTEHRSIEGMPVLIGELHSMLPVALCWIFGGKPPYPRVSYLMSDGAALPIALSKHVSCLKALRWLGGTVTYGHAYGGDLETVNRYTALLAARHVQRADIAVAAMGPGIAGTGTPYGHTAVEIAELVHAVIALGGLPVVIPRISFADARTRHRGLSHHLLESLGRLALAEAVIPLPGSLRPEERQLIERQLRESGCEDRHRIVWMPGPDPAETERRLSLYPEPVRTMGRGLSDDPRFFEAVCSAASFALSLVRAGETK